MIKGLFETHINVRSLERSMPFYEQTLGLLPGAYTDARRVAFYWMGAVGEAMLGLWEKPEDQIIPQHFAFRCDLDDLLHRAVPFLKERDIPCYNFLQDGTDQPMVFAWMPAISIYFKDPDGHELEFISMLKGEPRPEYGVVSYARWQEICGEIP